MTRPAMTALRLAALAGCWLALAGCPGAEPGVDPDAGAGAGADAGPVFVLPPTCVDLAALPSWRRGMAIGEWKKLSSANLAAVTPARLVGGGYYGRIDAWNGLAGDPDTSTLYLAAAGGHRDYAGNEVYSLALDADAPVWVMETMPSTQLSDNTPYYPDGKPSPTHLYYTEAYVPQRRKVYRFAGGATWGDGNGTTRNIDAWSPSSKAWDPARSNPEMGPSPTYEMPGALDLRTGDFYQVQANNRLYRWNQATNLVSDLGAAGAGRGSFGDLYKSPAVIDPTSNRLLLFHDEGNPGKVRVFDLVAGTWSSRAVTGDGAVTTGSEQAMAWFDVCAERIVMKTSQAGSTYLIDPMTLEAVALPTRGNAPPSPLNGVHTLFQSMPALGGYAYQPTHAAGLYFLATQ